VKILFTSTHETSFIREDLRILQSFSTVKHLIASGIMTVPRILAGVARADLTYTWFASTYAFVVVLAARILRRGAIIVVGGVDAARLPAIGYGIWTSRWRVPLVRFAVTRADAVLVVDDTLRENLVHLADYKGENITVVPTGYDAAWWCPGPSARRTDVLTVAACDTRERLEVKGVPWLLRVASTMTDVGFSIVGLGDEAKRMVQPLLSPNVRLGGPLSSQALRDAYRDAKVICVPSVFEGLPNSLCEGMLCGCIPVATYAGGAPQAVGETGFLVKNGDSAGLERSLRMALDLPEERRTYPRDRVAGLFPAAKREEALRRIIGAMQ
jgi:glycosyltransferase involved in cell wall biosynthesis